MNVTFMIGNGFDLNCGLRTSFNDVCEEYAKDTSFCVDPKYDDHEKKVIDGFKKRIKKNLPTWGDFERAMAKDAESFSNEKDFVLCVRNFKIFLDEYLESESKKLLSLDLDPLAQNHFLNKIGHEACDSISHFYHHSTNNVTRLIDSMKGKVLNYCFITFNYTPILNTVLSLSPRRNVEATIRTKDNNSYEIIHIHGQLGKDMILGIDNENQFNLNNLKFEVTKATRRAFIKPYFNSEFDQRRVDDATKRIEEADVICVFGMSFGVSDLSWKKRIAKWLLDSEMHHLFFYDYEESKRNVKSADEKLDREDDARERLVQKLGLEGKDFSRQIHIPVATNIFNIGEIRQEINGSAKIISPRPIENEALSR